MTLDVELALTLAVLTAAALTRSTFGFGDAMLAMPLLTLMLGAPRAAPLVALVALTIGVTITIANWGRVHWRSALRLILSSLVGIPLGLYGLAAVDEVVIKVVLALVVLSFSTYRLLGPSRQGHLETERWSWVFGLVGGVLGGAYNTNGPVIVIYAALRRWPPEDFRATLQAYFCTTGVFVVLGHGLSGNLTAPLLLTFAAALPLVLGAIALGGFLNRRIPTERFSGLISALLAVVALGLLASLLV